MIVMVMVLVPQACLVGTSCHVESGLGVQVRFQLAVAGANAVGSATVQNAGRLGKSCNGFLVGLSKSSNVRAIGLDE